MPTPEEPGQPHERPVLEPIRVLRPRNTDALAELFREMTELTQDTDAYEAIALPSRQAVDEARTEELPPLGPRPALTPPPRGGRDWTSERGSPRPGPVPGSGTSAARKRSGSRAAPVQDGARARARTDSGAGRRRAAITIAVCAAALVGFAGALLLPGRGGEAAAETPPVSEMPPASSAPTPAATAAGSADPDGAGTLREGDSGPEVSDLQKRLLRIPNVYDKGPTDGRYDTVLTEAVARFQLWYGIRGDESGVYGDDTRRDLESRTGGG
ncbi:peptidoglycan-binding domain-containing protein [Streptomyces sp. 3214.6]|uniref:peptidoglycan-binding domain-containing protein n=1 Tax=Streptomyces sp. 3214.6 TaxID=1882757 RepID=UPI00090A08CC|nr:peptidoglycan-binding domain-containing protein [Streptomyces sp. 3214.6]SHH55306.1 Putative peptidoglycan binding domain-containing protein [Streptomyces sp. 3214.6]